jgi:hypothetical protein
MSLRSEPHNHAARGAERTRTAVRALGTSYTYVCTCRKHGVDPTCVKHGWRTRVSLCAAELPVFRCEPCECGGSSACECAA